MKPDHTVQFFADGAFPTAEAIEFIAGGLRAGDACIVILTGPRRLAIEASLEAQGVVAAFPLVSTFDSEELISALVVNGQLDEKRAGEICGNVFTEAASAGNGRVRLLGDLAPELCKRGNFDAGIRLERLVHDLAQARGVPVFCTYPAEVIAGRRSLGRFMDICSEHTRICDLPSGSVAPSVLGKLLA